MIFFTLRVKEVKEISAIEFSWSNKKFEKACTDDRAGAKRWGVDNWRLLQRRLVGLDAAPTLADMSGAPGNCHALGADRAGAFAVDLWGPYRLVFTPDHDPVPRLEDGGIDRTQVTHIKIEEVVNYHGK